MATLGESPSEIFLENLNLQEDNKKLRQIKERMEAHPSVFVKSKHRELDSERLIDGSFASSSCKAKLRNIWSAMKYIVMFLMATAFIIIYVFIEQRKERSLHSLETKLSEPSKLSLFGPGILPVASQRMGDVGKVIDTLQKSYLNIGLNEDDEMEECQGPELKHSFPDVDYALLGYNILKGFPLAVGHDPGFTYPIFIADYSKGAQTADCRYSIPHGLIVIPDISCVTSFSSTTIQNKYEFAKALSVSASVQGGGWGVRFSASAGYKETSSELSTGESVSILSTANCNYYFSKLITEDSPKFDEIFLKWIYKLNATNSNDVELYFDFFETFGTHFPTEVTFGARYTYEYKMDSKLYETQKSSGVNVAAQASYSGLFSVGGGFNMDSSQRQAASDFSKSVTTKTITVGAAPPADGDAMTWASEVKTSPVPTAYKLVSIDNLFTETYMGHLNVDFKRIQGYIDERKLGYCTFLQQNGHVESCEDISAGIEMKNTRLFNHYRELMTASVTQCIETCMQEIACEATTFCLTCKGEDIYSKRCFLYKAITYDTFAKKYDYWQSNVFPEKIKTQIGFSNTKVIGNPRGFDKEEDKTAGIEKCKELCIMEAYCVAYTHCDCPEREVKCQMFSKQQVQGLADETGTKTFFITSRFNVWKTSTTDARVRTTSGTNNMTEQNQMHVGTSTSTP